MSLTTAELRSIATDVITTRVGVREDYTGPGRRFAEREICTELRIRTRTRLLDLNVEAERVRFLAVTVAAARELDRLVLAERAARRGDENGGAR